MKIPPIKRTHHPIDYVKVNREPLPRVEGNRIEEEEKEVGREGISAGLFCVAIMVVGAWTVLLMLLA